MLNCFFSKVCTIYYNQCSVAFVEYIYMSATFEGFFFFLSLVMIDECNDERSLLKETKQFALRERPKSSPTNIDINQSRKV